MIHVAQPQIRHFLNDHPGLAKMQKRFSKLFKGQANVCRVLERALQMRWDRQTESIVTFIHELLTYCTVVTVVTIDQCGRP